MRDHRDRKRREAQQRQDLAAKRAEARRIVEGETGGDDA
jgi:hypothetical protein